MNLPNALWCRSSKKPEYAICFDPGDNSYLWLMVEHADGDRWTSVRRLTLQDVRRLAVLDDADLVPFKGAIADALAMPFDDDVIEEHP